jgi:phage-related protein
LDRLALGEQVEAQRFDESGADATELPCILYHVAPDAIVILDVFAKKTAATPKRIIAQCRQTLTAFRKASHTKGGGHARR